METCLWIILFLFVFSMSWFLCVVSYKNGKGRAVSVSDLPHRITFKVMERMSFDKDMAILTSELWGDEPIFINMEGIEIPSPGEEFYLANNDLGNLVAFKSGSSYIEQDAELSDLK